MPKNCQYFRKTTTLLDKYKTIIMKKNLSQIKTGMILSYICIFAQCVISLVYTPIMLHFLGQSEYGVYSLCTSIIGYLGLLNFGLGSAYVKFYSKYNASQEKERIQQLNGMYLIIFSIIGIIVFLAGIILVKNSQLIIGNKITGSELKLSKILLFLLTINLSIYMPSSVFNAFISVHEKYIFLKGIDLVKTVSNPFLTLPLLIWGYGSIAVVAVTVVLTLISLVINIWYCIRSLKISFLFKNFDIKLIQSIWKFSFFIFLQMIMDQLNWQIDKLLLGRYCGSESVAIYSIGSLFTGYLVILSSSICNLFTPRVHKLVSEKQSDDIISHLFVVVSRIQFIIVSFAYLAFLFMGKSFIQIWVGNEYLDSYYIGLFLMLPLIIALTENLSVEILRAKNKHGFLNMIYVGICIINVIISIPLSINYGAIGAAIGTCITMLIAHLIISNFYYYKVGKINIILYFKEIISFLPSLILPCVLGLFILNYYMITSWADFVFWALFYSIIFMGSIWLFALKPNEKEIILTPLKQIFKNNFRSTL